MNEMADRAFLKAIREFNEENRSRRPPTPAEMDEIFMTDVYHFTDTARLPWILAAGELWAGGGSSRNSLELRSGSRGWHPKIRRPRSMQIRGL
jgi:hypothetical protein